jgi:O-acetylhomoserine sulfhydrylase
MQALMPNLVPTELFPRAAAWATSSAQAAVIIGPALGGLLYIYGPAVVYSVIGLLFLTASLLLFLMKVQGTMIKSPELKRQSLFAGLAYIRSKPEILGPVSLDLFAVLLGGVTALLPIYAQEILHTGPLGLGILRAAPAIGAMLMSAYLARHPLRQRVGRMMFIAVFIFGIATLVFAVSTSFVLSSAALIILGGADVVSVVIRASLVQLGTPDEMRGRVSAVNMLFIGASNQLGEFESGLTAAWFGTVPAASSFVFYDADHAAELFDLKQYGHIYSRISNPTVSIFEERMASLEGATGAVATASGMAAQLAVFMTLLEPGDEVVSSSHLYGGTFVATYLRAAGYRIIPVNPRADRIFGEPCYPNLASIPEHIDLVDIFRPSADCLNIVEEAVACKAKAVWLQLKIINLEAAELAQKAGLLTVMDLCLKMEHGRYSGGLHEAGMNTEIISSQRTHRYI